MLGEALLDEKTPLKQQGFRKSERQKKQKKKHSEAKIHVLSFGYLGNQVVSFFLLCIKLLAISSPHNK